MSQALDNKTFVIIGGTTGLGLSAAKAFVGEGARVVVVGRNAESVAQAETELGQAARAGRRSVRWHHVAGHQW